MKKINALSRIASLVLVLFGAEVNAQSVGVSDSPISPDSDALLELRSTTKGVLLPRMTQAQITTFTTAANGGAGLGTSDKGMTVFNTTTNRYKYWDGTTWQDIVPGGLQAIDAGNGLTVNNSDPTLPKVELGGDLDQHTQVRANAFNLKYVVNSNVGGGRIAIGSTAFTPNDLYSLSVERPGDGNEVRIGGADWGLFSTVNEANEYGFVGENTTNSASGTSYGVLGRMQNLNNATGALGMYSSAIGSVGVYGNVTAGASNFSGYFEGGKVQVNTNSNGLNVPLLIRNFNGAQLGGNAVGIGFTNEGIPTSNYYKAAIVHERLGNNAMGRLHFLNSNLGAEGSATLADSRMSIASDGTIRVNALGAGGNRIVQVDNNGDLFASNTLPTGSGNYIQNQNSVDQGADFRISGTGVIGAVGGIGTSKFKVGTSATDFSDFRIASAGGGQLEHVAWTNGWNINTMTANKNLYLNRDAPATSNLYIGRVGFEMFVRGSDGYIGLGNAAPSARIHTSGTGAGNGLKINGADVYDEGSWFRINHSGTSTWWGQGDGYINFSDAAGSKAFYFRDNASVVKGSINSAGTAYFANRVGIGTTPSYPLHVTTTQAGDWQGRFTNGGANVYLAHQSGYGMHINTGGTNSSGRYALEVRNASQTHFYVRDDGWVGVGRTDPSSRFEILNNTNAINNNSYNEASLEVATNNGSNPSIGFHREGFSATALYHAGYGNNSLRIRNADGLDAALLHEGNVGTYGIQNQNAVVQTANFRISGTGDVNAAYRFQGTNVIYNSGTDVYANIRVLQSNSTINDGMYLNYNSTGGGGAHLRFFANGTTQRGYFDAGNGNLYLNRNLVVSTDNVTGGGIFLADDGSIVDNNDGYASMRFSNGVTVNAGLNNNTQRIILRSDGNIQMVNNGAPTLNFNDSDQPDYYLHTNSDRLYFLHGDGYNAWNGNRPLTIFQGNKVGINAETPAIPLAVGGNGTDVYATSIWSENNIHVQGNETLTQGGRGRLRVGTAWSYVGLYADNSSSGAANDLVLGAGSGTVRIGCDGCNQRLYVNHNTKAAGSNAIYAYNTGNVNGGTGYAYNTSSAGIRSFSLWGNSYDFAVAGYSWNDNPRSGGVIGGNYAGGTWESCGYKASNSTIYGEYYTSTASGAGFLPSGSGSANIGSGGYGDFVGAWTRGGVIGHMAAGELIASYNMGDEITSGRQMEIVTTSSARHIAYTNTSADLTITKAGVAELVGGRATVVFGPEFSDMIAKGEMPIVTVTPLGETKGVFVTSADQGGFSVQENGAGTSNVRFTYMVMAKRVDAEVQPMKDVMAPDFDRNLKEFMFNEAIRERDGRPMWWDGNSIRFDQIPAELLPSKKN